MFRYLSHSWRYDQDFVSGAYDSSRYIGNRGFQSSGVMFTIWLADNI